MATRSFWKGYLKLSLVTCPVAMAPAISESEKVRFHTLNRATGHRVQSRYIDAETGEVVEPDDQVKGYEIGEKEYITLEDEEIEAVALESTRTIDLEIFVPKNSIEWIWYDRPHYLVPDDPVGQEAFSVIREAMAATETVGISRLVLYRRERALMLEPRGRGIIVWTLRQGDEIRDPQIYFGAIKTEKADPKPLSMVTTLIAERTRAWDPSMVRDPVQEHLLEIIAAKAKGQYVAKAKPLPVPPSNVVSIMDALRKSIAAEESRSGRSRGRRRPGSVSRDS